MEKRNYLLPKFTVNVSLIPVCLSLELFDSYCYLQSYSALIDDKLLMMKAKLSHNSLFKPNLLPSDVR